MKELINLTTIQAARTELAKYANKTVEASEFMNYLNSRVFENQVLAYTNEMNWSVNEFVNMILEVNGIAS